METQTDPAGRPSCPGQHPVLGPRNTPCHPPPISAIFHDLPKKVSDFPHFCAIIGSAAYTPYQEDAEHAQTIVATRPRPPARRPRRGGTFVSQKNHHIAAFETNILGIPCPRPHRPGPAEGRDLCFPKKPPHRSLRNKHPRHPLPQAPSSRARGGEGPLFPKKTTTSQPSKQTSCGSPFPGQRAGGHDLPRRPSCCIIGPAGGAVL
jgi:hypothetical protein